MQYHIDADEEFLRVTISGRDEDRPPSEVCALVLAESRKRNRKRILIELDQKFPLSPTSQYAQNANHFINLLARNHAVMVRNFTGLEPAKEWLRGNSS